MTEPECLRYDREKSHEVLSELPSVHKKRYINFLLLGNTVYKNSKKQVQNEKLNA